MLFLSLQPTFSDRQACKFADSAGEDGLLQQMHQVAAAPLQQALPQNMAVTVSQPAAVAVKKEYDAYTDDDEAALSAANQNSVSEDVASMVAVKTEYNSDTDDEAATAADKNSASGAASMVAIKKEYDADNDSDEENQPPIKKAKKGGDNEHEKHIAEIRKITDQMLSRGRQHDATVSKQIRQIANDLESFSNELKKSANDVEERHRNIELRLSLMLHASTCTQESYCNFANCAKMKVYLKHGTTCKVKAPGGCKLCKRVYTLLRIHAISKQCKQENCPVPDCVAIRERVRQIRSQQQARMIDVGK